MDAGAVNRFLKPLAVTRLLIGSVGPKQSTQVQINLGYTDDTA